MFVPFARLLRLWDERPEDFDEYEIHSLHWVFKWMSAGMLDQPHIPLASIEKWLGEMEHRYRLAGHSERAVRSAEFSVAAHIGDLARAERAYAAWLAADRDTMADCLACELHGQGWWRARRREDAEALELWAPVLEGEYTCAHEPHTVLASSLVPLLRLGRPDEARAHHLRGFRLVRAMESMRGAYADHVEFCALTGNEARGLELLAERPAYFTDSGDPRSKLDFMSCGGPAHGPADRTLGSAIRRSPVPPGVPGPPANWPSHAREEALSLAARFDERNGTTYVGTHVRERMDRPPLLDRLPLGVRLDADRRSGAARPGGRTPVEPPATAAGRPARAARRGAAARRRPCIPDAVEAWAAVARAAEAEGAELDTWRPRRDRRPRGHRSSGRRASRLFERAAELYEEAGDPGEALAARARGGVRARPGRATSTRPWQPISEPYERDPRALRRRRAPACGRRRPCWWGGRGSSCSRIARGRRPRTPARWHAAEDAVRELRSSSRRTPRGGRTARPRGPRRRGRCSGSWPRAAGTRRRPPSCSPGRAAVSSRPGCPGSRWSTRPGSPGSRTTSATSPRPPSGRPARRPGARRGRIWSRRVTPSCTSSSPRSLGARRAGRRGRRHALEAAHWADEAGEGPTLGAWARHLLGGFLLRLGRWAEAAEVLESALPDLTAETHGDGAVVQTLWWLGDCLTELGEHREAAERSAAGRRHRPALARAARPRDARPPRRRVPRPAPGCPPRPTGPTHAPAISGASLGNVHGLVRALRARAWLALRDGGGAGRGTPRGCRTRSGECDAALSEADRRGVPRAARRRTRPHPPPVRRPAGPLRRRGRGGRRDRGRLRGGAGPDDEGDRGVRLARARRACTAAPARSSPRGGWRPT